MASSWFLQLAFKCLYHFAWPLVALVYPMCASVQAIETDSYAETKDLISYWILLSFIYLFEYAFMNLLLWFQLWPYTKLVIIFWLITPNFGRASYVYNKLIRSMKPQIVAWGLNNYWKKWFFEKDNFLMHAERYMKENGTEALEKLIASKNTMCRSDAEATNEISATDDKEMLKTNGERLQTKQKDIKDLEAIEKKEIPATKQDIPVMLKIRPSQNASSVTVETKGSAESERAGGEVPRSSIQREVQREWTCALCLVRTKSEKDLISHLNGRKHRDTSEALIAKKQSTRQKQKDAEATTNKTIATDIKKIPKKNGERLQTENKDIKHLEAIDKKEIPASKQRMYANIVASQKASSTIVETKGIDGSDTAGGEVPRSSTATQKEVQKEWTCALCLVTTSSQITLNSHINGRKHRAACEAALKAKKQPAPQKNLSEPFRMDIPVTPKVAPRQNASSASVETKGTAKSDKSGEESLMSSTLKEVQKEWTCALCSVTTSSKITLNSHLNGRKHWASCEAALKANKQPAPQKLKIYQSKEEEKQKNVSNKLNSNVKSGDTILKKGLKGTVVMDDKVQKNQSEPVTTHNSKSICRICNVVLLSEANVVSHMNGKKHLAKMQSKVDSLNNFRDIGIA